VQKEADMAVIAMTREMGTLGKDVAAGVADRLGLDLVYHELSDKIATHMHMTAGAVSHFLDGTAHLLDRLTVSKRKLALFTREEIFDIALKDNVLVRGWGATCILSPVSHVVRVRVRAPMEVRVQRMVERIDGWTSDMAHEQIRQSDAAHDAVLRKLCGVEDWESERHYHRILDTGRESVDKCIEVLISLAQESRFEPSSESLRTLHELASEARSQGDILDNQSAAAEYSSAGL
jgi:cytidylate kinase